MSATLVNISLTLILRDPKCCKFFETRLILNHLNGVIIKGHEIFLGCYWARGEIFFSLSKNGWHFSFEWKFLTQQWLSRDPFLKWTPENSTWPKWKIMAKLVVEFQVKWFKVYSFLYSIHFFQNYKYLVFHLGRHIFHQRIEASILTTVLKNL